MEFSDTARQDEDGFDALAQDHQENEQKQAEGGIAAGQEADFAFDLSLKRAARLHHENDHADDEESGDQHDPAFENVLIPVAARQQDGDPNAADEGGKQSRKDGFAQFGTTNLGQIGQGDADNERGFDPFAQSYDECL